MKAIPTALLVGLTCMATPCGAQTAGGDNKVDRLINLLVQQGVITPDKARALRSEAATEPGQAMPGSPAGARGPSSSPSTSSASQAAVATNSSAAPAASGETQSRSAATMAAADNMSAVRQPEAARAPAAPRRVVAKATPGFPNNRDPSVDPSAPVVRNAGFAAQDAPWTDRLRIDGDIRLRWQAEYLDNDTSSTIPNWAALAGSGTSVPVTSYISDADRARLRYRARLGVTARIDDHFTAVIRLAAGNLTEPTSTDQTLGDFLNRDGFGVDRAYIQWQPTKSLTLTGGRMANPFYTTNLMFDGDVNPEGVAASYRHPLKIGYLFATGSVWYVQENAGRTPDRYVYAGQIGAAGLPLGDRTHLRIAASYYDWSHYRGTVGDTSTATQVLGQGNTLVDLDTRAATILPGIASPFRIVELLGAVSQRLGSRYAVSGAVDLAVNTAYDRSALEQLPLLTQPGGNVAWLGAITVGDPNVAESRQWQITGSYRRLQSDSIVAAFTEGDYNPGGTNREVETIEGLIGLDHNAWLQLSYFHNRFIVGPHYAYDAIRTQLNVRF